MSTRARCSVVPLSFLFLALAAGCSSGTPLTASTDPGGDGGGSPGAAQVPAASSPSSVPSLSDCFAGAAATRLSFGPDDALTLSCERASRYGGRSTADGGAVLEETSLDVPSVKASGSYTNVSFERSYTGLDLPEYGASTCTADVAAAHWPPASGDHVTGNFVCTNVAGSFLNGTSGEGTFSAAGRFDVVAP